MPGRNRQRGRAALKGRDAFFQDGVGRISNAGVDVAERLQSEQRCSMIGIIEYKGRGLIDRRPPRAGSGIGLRAGMNGEGRKSRRTIGHSFSFTTASSRGAAISAAARRMSHTV